MVLKIYYRLQQHHFKKKKFKISLIFRKSKLWIEIRVLSLGYILVYKHFKVKLTKIGCQTLVFIEVYLLNLKAKIFYLGSSMALGNCKALV